MHLTVHARLLEAEGRAVQITVYGPGIDDVQQAKPKAAAKRDVPLSEIQVRAWGAGRGTGHSRGRK